MASRIFSRRPRRKRRGPIEADNGDQSRRTTPRNIRDGNVAAPLKPGRITAGRRSRPRYIRDGNVAAPLKRYCVSRRITFTCYIRDGNVAAPLKRRKNGWGERST